MRCFVISSKQGSFPNERSSTDGVLGSPTMMEFAGMGNVQFLLCVDHPWISALNGGPRGTFCWHSLEQKYSFLQRAHFFVVERLQMEHDCPSITNDEARGGTSIAT